MIVLFEISLTFLILRFITRNGIIARPSSGNKRDKEVGHFTNFKSGKTNQVKHVTL